MLTPKQKAFVETFLREHMARKSGSDDTSVYCEACGLPGDCTDIEGRFDVVMPLADNAKPGKGYRLDDLRAIWICSICIPWPNSVLPLSFAS